MFKGGGPTIIALADGWIVINVGGGPTDDKPPRERVAELVEAGRGDPFAPARKVLREWVTIPTVDRRLWHRLLAEAVDFAGLGLGLATRHP